MPTYIKDKKVKYVGRKNPCPWETRVVPSILLWLWQLPQNILGWLWWLIQDVIGGGDLVMRDDPAPGIVTIYSCRQMAGVSLGKYDFLDLDYFLWRDEKAKLHEYGHSRQSRMLGPLYLIVIGLPSVIGNLWDRLFHKGWEWKERERWYYNQPWEKWADKLGGVER